MYIPLSLGISTLASLLAVVVGQIWTLFKVNKLQNTRHCSMMQIEPPSEEKKGWMKTAWEFVKLTWDKFKDKFKDKAAEKIVDETVETTQEVVSEASHK